MSDPFTELDYSQVLQHSFDEPNNALRVTSIAGGGTLVSEQFDSEFLTYVPSGNGVGEIATITYKLAGVTVATLTLTYNSDNKLTSVVKT